jgi:hypothetical protein
MLEVPFSNGPPLLFGFLLTESDAEILKGHMAVFPIQEVSGISHLPPHPESNTLREKIDEKAESLENQVNEITDHFLFQI